MMDIEKLIRRLRNDADAYRNGETLGRAFADQEDVLDNAATALSTLQAENEKLRAEVESLKKGYCAGCSIPAVKAEQIRDLTDAPKLRAELEQVKRERDAAKSTLAERIGVRGAEPITTAFGLPIDRLRELAKADREGRCVVLPESYYTAEAAARKASGPAEQSERGQAAAWIMQRFGRMS